MLGEHVSAVLGDPVGVAALLSREPFTRVWRVVHHYVDAAVEAQNLESVERVGIDETSFRRGHEYVSVFADLDQRRGVFVVEGKDHQTVQAFSLFLQTHGGHPEQVSEVCQEMSEALLKGSLTHLRRAEVTFDRYDVRSRRARTGASTLSRRSSRWWRRMSRRSMSSLIAAELS